MRSTTIAMMKPIEMFAHMRTWKGMVQEVVEAAMRSDSAGRVPASTRCLIARTRKPCVARRDDANTARMEQRLRVL